VSDVVASAEARRFLVVIPHHGGWGILERCLEHLGRGTVPCRVLVVDNASPDDSVARVRRAFPWVEVAELPHNLGFAGGCNVGLRAALEDPACHAVALLNNDTEPAADWLEQPRAMLDADPRLGAVQPRLLSIPFPGKLDYSGAAGGLLDVYAFPFALGRVLGHLEEDGPDWMEPRRLAWASGTACLLRCGALRDTGLLEESFFMHMEEIDLCWRLRLRGWGVAAAPAARVLHHSGYSLGSERPLKVYLNHRNSLRMLTRNAGSGTLARRLPFRLVLDLAATVSYLAAGRPAHALAALRGVAGWLRRLPVDLRSRRAIQADRTVDEPTLQSQHYGGSIALAARLRGVTRVAGLGWLPPLWKEDSARV